MGHALGVQPEYFMTNETAPGIYAMKNVLSPYCSSIARLGSGSMTKHLSHTFYNTAVVI